MAKKRLPRIREIVTFKTSENSREVGAMRKWRDREHGICEIETLYGNLVVANIDIHKVRPASNKDKKAWHYDRVREAPKFTKPKFAIGQGVKSGQMSGWVKEISPSTNGFNYLVAEGKRGFGWWPENSLTAAQIEGDKKEPAGHGFVIIYDDGDEYDVEQLHGYPQVFKTEEKAVEALYDAIEHVSKEDKQIFADRGTETSYFIAEIIRPIDVRYYNQPQIDIYDNGALVRKLNQLL